MKADANPSPLRSRSVRLLRLAVCLLLLLGGMLAKAGDELEHRHMVYAIARAVGFSEKESEVISAASWSVDNNDATVALPSRKEWLEMSDAAHGTALPDSFPRDGYYTRGFAFHALGGDESREVFKSWYKSEINQMGQGHTERLVRAGIYLHYLVDSYVHPYNPIIGHALEAHAPDYSINQPGQYATAIDNAYKDLRVLYLQVHPGSESAMRMREKAFCIDVANPRGVDFFSTKLEKAIMEAQSQAPKDPDSPVYFAIDVPTTTVEAKANLNEAFRGEFRKVNEQVLSVPEFRRIVYERSETGKITFRRNGTDAVLGSMDDPAAFARSGNSPGSTLLSHEIAAYDHEFTSLITAARCATGPLTLGANGVSLSAEATSKITRVLADQPVGGVSMKVVIDFLSQVSPIVRKGHRTRTVSNPTLVSLRNLLSRVGGGGSKTWPTDREALLLGGLTRIYGYIIDPNHSDIILIGSRELSVAPIGLESLAAAIQCVYRDGLTPSVSLDPSPGNPHGLQYCRTIGINGETAFSHIMLDADYAMKRIMLGDLAANTPGYKSMIEILGTRSDFEPGWNRFWFYPVRFSKDDIRMSRAGDVVLFDSKFQVLTEAMSMAADGIAGLGHADPAAEQGAAIFTEYMPQLEENVVINGRYIFKELHGLLDVTTLCTLWRLQDTTELLQMLADLPLPKRQTRAAYPGISTSAEQLDGRFFSCHGGVQIQRWIGSRHLDRFDDVQTIALRSAALAFADKRRMSIDVSGLTIYVSESPLENVAENSLELAISWLARDDYTNAIAAFGRTIAVTPDMYEAYALRGVAEMRLKDFHAAQADMDKAAELEPENGWIQAGRVALAVEQGSVNEVRGYRPRLRSQAIEQYRLKAARLFAAGRYTEAEETYTKALQLTDGLKEKELNLLVDRGNTREAMANLDSARMDYDEAEGIYFTEKKLVPRMWWPDAPRLLVAQGRLEVAMGEYDRILSPEASHFYLARFFDAPIRLEADTEWGKGKAIALNHKRHKRINDGFGISRAWSSYEVSVLQEAARRIETDLREASVNGELQDSLAPIVAKAQEEVRVLKENAELIEQSELKN